MEALLHMTDVSLYPSHRHHPQNVSLFIYYTLDSFVVTCVYIFTHHLVFFFDFCIICHHYYFKYSQEVHVDLVSCFVRRVSSFSLSLRSFIHSHVIVVIIFHPYFYICFDETFLLLSFWYSQQTDANITLTFRIYFVTQNFLVAACLFYCLSFCHIIWGFCFF